MKNSIPILLLLLSCTIYNVCLNAQVTKRSLADTERFNAGLIIGLNISQLDGDYFVGYDKAGLTGGIKGIVGLTPRLDFNMELLYSQKGSKIFSGNKLGTSPIKDRIVDLHYVDVPLLLKWRLRDTENSWHIEAGIVYSRLLDTKITEKLSNPAVDFSYKTILNDFESADLAGTAGFGYSWKGGLSFHGRFIFGLTRFYENANFVPSNSPPTRLPAVEFLRNYFVSFQVAYALF